MQIPFNDLRLIIYVDFLLISEDVPSLLSMKGLVENGLDISIHDNYVSLWRWKKRLKMSNYFLIHEWRPTDVPFDL